jgi:hypothetical protein
MSMLPSLSGRLSRPKPPELATLFYGLPLSFAQLTAKFAEIQKLFAKGIIGPETFKAAKAGFDELAAVQRGGPDNQQQINEAFKTLKSPTATPAKCPHVILPET